MAGIVVLVISIAALDSLNPSTLIPAVVLALGPSPRRSVLAFTTGVFVTSTLGGIVLLFAVGRPLLTRLSHPSAHAKHVVELVVGVVLMAVGAALWKLRARVRSELGGTKPGRGRSAFVLGAGIMAVELPTAFPYFAAILATVAAARGPVTELVLVLAYNVVFVTPLLVVAFASGVATRGGRDRLMRASELLQRWAPVAVPIGVATIGLVLAVIGATGL
jgi:cytochrome c biogenesis protein CcdA